MRAKKLTVKSKKSPKKASKKKHWINWNFPSNKKPFSVKMSNSSIYLKLASVEKIVEKYISDPIVWHNAGLVFTNVILIKNWSVSGFNPVVLNLTVDAVDPTQPPGSGTVVPPAPKQPPPPSF